MCEGVREEDGEKATGTENLRRGRRAGRIPSPAPLSPPPLPGSPGSGCRPGRGAAWWLGVKVCVATASGREDDARAGEAQRRAVGAAWFRSVCASTSAAAPSFDPATRACVTERAHRTHPHTPHSPHITHTPRKEAARRRAPKKMEGSVPRHSPSLHPKNSFLPIYHRPRYRPGGGGTADPSAEPWCRGRGGGPPYGPPGAPAAPPPPPPPPPPTAKAAP